MAEPQRASSLPAASARPKPRPRHPSLYAAPLRLPLDETQDLGPPVQATEPADPTPPAEEESPRRSQRGSRARRPAVPRPPARSPGDWMLLVVLLLGLALNAVALLVNSALSRFDLLLGGAVFLAGIALLVLMELCRRTSGGSS